MKLTSHLIRYMMQAEERYKNHDRKENVSNMALDNLANKILLIWLRSLKLPPLIISNATPGI
jgi:hypothetical protein